MKKRGQQRLCQLMEISYHLNSMKGTLFHTFNILIPRLSDRFTLISPWYGSNKKNLTWCISPENAMIYAPGSPLYHVDDNDMKPKYLQSKDYLAH
jgi:hypothetical protein